MVSSDYVEAVEPHLARVPVPERTDLLDANGAPVYNLFPRQQAVTFYPTLSGNLGTAPTSVTSPVPPPAMVIPQLVTPTATDAPRP